MKTYGDPSCSTCQQVERNCGGHWSRYPRQAVTRPDGKRGNPNLDTTEGNDTGR